MDWRAKVELYEQIRREYEFGVGSVIGVARKSRRICSRRRIASLRFPHPVRGFSPTSRMNASRLFPKRNRRVFFCLSSVTIQKRSGRGIEP